MASTISAGTTAGSAIVVSGDTSGSLALQTNGTTTAVTIDTSQNVGIGTTSPATKLDVNGSIAVGSITCKAVGGEGGQISLNNTSDTASAYNFDVDGSNHGRLFTTQNNTNLSLGTLAGTGGIIALYTAGTERMRIDSSGVVFMGQTTNPATGTLVLKVPTGTGNGINAQITSNTGTSYPFSNYNASSAYVGGISCTSSATAFPTSSDKRLKKNIKDAPSAINKILTAQVVSHDWLNDVAHVEYGFVAQDLQDTIPQAVVEGTDKENGSIDMPWSVDYSKIVPLLVKSIQEQQTIINDLKARITALEAK